MKRKNILHSLICLMAVSCTVQEIDTQYPISPVKESPAEQEVFYASLESYSSPETKVYVDEDISLHWDAEDKLSIFNRNTLNHPYQFSGKTGDVSGYFTRVSDPIESEDNLDVICAVYPYRESTTISDSGELTLTLPAEQKYKVGSFGPEANTMVSTTDGHLLKFKNVGGYLALKFYGEGISVSSIRLDGNKREPLSGEVTINPAIGADPSITTWASTAGTSITLTCENPVELGDANNPTIFWLVVPPTVFSNGFRLTVTDPNGNVFFKETEKTLSIVRNGVLRISPIQVMLNSNNLSISDISPVTDGINYTADDHINYKFTAPDDEPRTVYVTMPTVTKFSNLVLNYNVPTGATVLVNGEDIENGVTPIDASTPVTLTVRNGSYGKNYTLKARNTGLPVVRITTTGFTLADIEGDPVHQTVWRGTDPDDPTSTQGASIVIELANGDKDCEMTMQIKGRGNATWGYPKRPYALKFNSGKKVLGMPSHKRWVLLANWKDRTLLRNDAAFWLSRQVSDVIKSTSFPYTVKGQFVELEINGEHRGNYYLCEQIKINSKRVKITEMAKKETDPYKITGGYLMEIDNNWDNDNSFYSGENSGGFKYKYQFKEPDEKDRSAEAEAYMKSFIATMESKIKAIKSSNSKEYRDYIDTESAIWFMIINELTSNGDFYNENYSDTYKGPHSTYLYKDRDVMNEDGTTTLSKLHMGPVWDFDYLTFMPSRANKWAGADQKNYYYNYFYADSDFLAEMHQIWDDYKDYFLGLPDHIDSMAETIRLSEEIDARMWWNTSAHGNQDQNQNGELDMSFDEAVANIKSGFSGKWTFMDNNIKKLSYQKPGSSWGW